MSATAETEGKYCLGVLCNALWYITNDHQTMADRCKHVSGVIPAPRVYERYEGYNDLKRKKQKSNPLKRETLAAHSEALYGFVMKPYMRSSVAWKSESENIELLANCLHNCKDYLKTLSERVKVVNTSSTPARKLDTDTLIEFRMPQEYVEEKYKLLDSALKKAGLNVPVIFKEDTNLVKPFSNRGIFLRN